MRQSISAKIFDSLKAGKNLLGKEAIDHLTTFVKSQMISDQSFKNKSGKSDLYYTLFGWMLCLILDIRLDINKMTTYLNNQKEEDLDLIHYTAYKRCQLIYFLMKHGKIITWFRMLKNKSIKSLNEFNSVPHGDFNAPYTQFIWLSLIEDTGNKLKDDKTVQETLVQYRMINGGYLNVKDGQTATTNATVAALSVLGQTQGYQHNKDVEFLKNIQSSNGGFPATNSSPVPDLLSTATALFMLKCYQQKPKYNALDFIEAHWSGHEGFMATLLDEKSDVEYCFYGLLALGCV